MDIGTAISIAIVLLSFAGAIVGVTFGMMKVIQWAAKD